MRRVLLQCWLPCLAAIGGLWLASELNAADAPAPAAGAAPAAAAPAAPASAPAAAAPAPAAPGRKPTYRSYPPGVEVTIQPDRQEDDTHAAHDIMEIVSYGK